MTLPMNSIVHTLSVLYVEDTIAYAQRLKITLESQANCRVHLAHTGLEGVAAACQHHFDLIILDVELPDIDGFEVCRRLKAELALVNIPIIMLTTRDRAGDALRGFLGGVVDYIPKDTFAEMVLLETIRQMNLREKEHHTKQ